MAAIEKGVEAVAGFLRPAIEEALGRVRTCRTDSGRWTTSCGGSSSSSRRRRSRARRRFDVPPANLYAAARSAQLSQRLTRPWPDGSDFADAAAGARRDMHWSWRWGPGWRRRSRPSFSSPPSSWAASASPTPCRDWRFCTRSRAASAGARRIDRARASMWLASSAPKWVASRRRHDRPDRKRGLAARGLVRPRPEVRRVRPLPPTET